MSDTPTMKKFAVHYECRIVGAPSYIHIFATSAEEAKKQVEEGGIGYSNGKVYADRITKVEEVQTESGN